MSRRIAITILACLAGLWLAAASAQDKINPNQVTPNKVNPPPVIPNPVIKPPPLPADPTGGVVGERAKQDIERAREAARLEELAEQQSGLDAKMGAGPGDDRPGFDKGDETLMQRLCKSRAARQVLLGQCGSDPGALPPDGDPYTTDDSTKPGSRTPFDVPTAGSGVPSRGSTASDDEERKPDRRWTDAMGQKHEQWEGNQPSRDGDVFVIIEYVSSPDRGFEYASVLVVGADRRPGVQPGGLRVHEATRFRDGTFRQTVRHCQRGHCTDSQPGEPGYGQIKVIPWACILTPTAENFSSSLTPGFEIDPANPDGEGTPTGSRPTRETPRVGRGAVSDPGPADSEIRGTSGGGSKKPLDMKDPVNPDGPVKPDRPR
jgi:hypothetical protein